MNANRLSLQEILHSSNLLLALALGLSAFTFLWNPLGFPPIKYEDGTYIGRAMHVLIAHTPQEGKFYDHPYFGQLFLAGILWIVGYPESMHATAEGDVLMSVEVLWMVPKVIIGLFGIMDTFLIYKISERRYDARTGFIASILFALMSISFLRTVFLESLQLPLLLSSVLFALGVKGYNKKDKENKKLSNAVISGIFMGLAIFTKIPAFVMIPLLVYLISTDNNKKLKTLSLWIIPVVLIPSIWPLYAISHAQLDDWLNGIYYQTHRQSAGSALESDKETTLANSITMNFMKMPLIFVLGFSGLVFAALKKDYFLLLWAIPFLGFLYFIGFSSEFHIIPILPLLFISSARVIVGLSDMITYRKIGEVLPFFIILAIAGFGVVNVMIQVTKDSNANRLELSAFGTRYLHENRDMNTTMIATHVYSWIPEYVFRLGESYWIPEEIDLIDTSPKINRSLIVVDGSFKSIMSGNDEIGQRLQKVYNTYIKNHAPIVEVGSYKMLLPANYSFYNGLTQVNATNLLSSQYQWKLKGQGHLSYDDGSLKILVKTNGTDEITRDTMLKTQLNNVTESPLLLWLLYTSKSPGGKDTFSVEIRDNDSQKRYFKGLLNDTSGNEENQLFVLPKEIAGKPMDFRFRVTTNASGEHTLTLKSAKIIDKF